LICPIRLIRSCYNEIMERPESPCPIHVVLVEPEIPQNTGNIARSCLAVGATLHLVKPYGFFLSDRHLQRAGLDYWDEVQLVEYGNLDHFLAEHENEPLALFSRKGEKRYTEIPVEGPLFLIFGRESLGLPETLLTRFPDRTYRLPMREGVRSLNLASTATVVLYEALRRQGFPGLS
jgi:tRNA (cytidine/uridine-2'-O-)-methyltransferase